MLRICSHTWKFTKRVWEMSSQLFVINLSLCTQTVEATSPEPISWIPLITSHCTFYYFFFKGFLIDNISWWANVLTPLCVCSSPDHGTMVLKSLKIYRKGRKINSRLKQEHILREDAHKKSGLLKVNFLYYRRKVFFFRGF